MGLLVGIGIFTMKGSFMMKIAFYILPTNGIPLRIMGHVIVPSSSILRAIFKAKTSTVKKTDCRASNK